MRNWHATSIQNMRDTTAGCWTRQSRSEPSIFSARLSHAGDLLKPCATLDRIGLRRVINSNANANIAKSAAAEVRYPPCATSKAMLIQPAIPSSADVSQYTLLSRNVAVIVGATAVPRSWILIGSDNTGPSTVR